MPKITAPVTIVLVRPYWSAMLPANRDEIAAGMRMDETTTPWRVADITPMVFSNDFIVVTGPMVPVSSLH